METTLNSAAGPVSSSSVPDWIALVRAKVEGLRYGVVQLVVHDGRVTQLECTEKTRLSPATGRDAQNSAQG